MRPMSEDELSALLLRLMHKAKTDPALIYAFKKTGRLVTAQNRLQLTPEELQEWDDALDEYYRELKKFDDLTNPNKEPSCDS